MNHNRLISLNFFFGQALSNRWYARGIETAVIYSLTDDLKIRRLTSPLFLSTKLEAYLGRGENDPLTSHDLEDILLVVDGREELIAEIEGADEDIRNFIAEHFRSLQEHEDFTNFVNGNLRGPEGRVEIVLERWAKLAEGVEAT